MGRAGPPTPSDLDDLVTDSPSPLRGGVGVGVFREALTATDGTERLTEGASPVLATGKSLAAGSGLLGSVLKPPGKNGQPIRAEKSARFHAKIYAQSQFYRYRTRTRPHNIRSKRVIMEAKILNVSDAGMIRAAGGLIYRNGRRGLLELAIVHRPAYDDWTFPKGKLNRDETPADAALRETEEETGLRCKRVGEAG